MARRKRYLDDGDDSDSDGNSDSYLAADNPDAREERELFENPYRKRRKTNGNEDDSEDEGFSNRGNRSKRSDWTKAPAFVSSDVPVKLGDSMQVISDSKVEEDFTKISDNQGDDDDDSDGSEGENEIQEGAEYSDESEPSRAPSPPLRNGDELNTKSTAKPVSLPVSEMAHFHKLQGTFGAKMLAKMGWKAGTGLGVEGEGIVTPIETKLRPQKMGIAFKGFKEKTDQSKMEARRRGDILSDDEDENTKKMRKKMKAAEQKRSEVWKRPKKPKTKIEHKTYEQILAEAGEEAPAIGIGQIIDARGPVVCGAEFLALTLTHHKFYFSASRNRVSF